MTIHNYLSTLTMKDIPARAREYIVNGQKYLVWSDCYFRGTFAFSTSTNEARQIYSGGYIHKDKTVQEAIFVNFKLQKEETKTHKARILTSEQKAKKAARAKARREAKKVISSQAKELGVNVNGLTTDKAVELINYTRQLKAAQLMAQA